ncbi:MAG: histidine kinase [Alphaproteobacteria bacterium]|nr:histidine kinase [Alphaproteobacteria bacterium]
MGDILSLIRSDLIKRATKIVDDARPEALHLLNNNNRILSLLTEAVELAAESTKTLERSFSASTAGQPRIGER